MMVNMTIHNNISDRFQLCIGYGSCVLPATSLPSMLLYVLNSVLWATEEEFQFLCQTHNQPFHRKHMLGIVLTCLSQT